ncbi:hypothetical protein [Methylobacterium aquaticum]|uniref:Transcriptional regulator n=1 Tax=Methylobacterium aquaticum TaxID=270351 RepID=A0A0C6FR32_9HYPH|nr:hypothetical protein [Methylobacterium aquaticum]BAQ49547.1 hypothetical protein Maq22A_1p36750 [Methylobacterium aquaticum]
MSKHNGGPKLPSPEAEAIATLGQAMYGARWQSELASDIGESPRVLRFWLSSDRVPPVMALKRARLAARRQVARIQRALDAPEPPAA